MYFSYIYASFCPIYSLSVGTAALEALREILRTRLLLPLTMYTHSHSIFLLFCKNLIFGMK